MIELRKDLSLAMSLHTYFTLDELVVRLIARVDGESLWDKPFTAPDGTTKRSWAVTHAERS